MGHRQDRRSYLRKGRKGPNGHRLPTRTPRIRTWRIWWWIRTQLLQRSCPNYRHNVPVVTPVDVPVTVAYPAPIKTCVDKPINLPVVTCADISEERTIQVPSVVDSEVIVAKCVAGLGAPACQKVELTLPKQVCVELVYGYAHEPAPAPAYPAAPAPHA